MDTHDLWSRLEPVLVAANGGKPLPAPNREGWINTISSPLREDRHPSFCVKLPAEDDPGGWTDHGTGEGGALPGLARRLGIELHERTRATFLQARALPPNAAERFGIAETTWGGRPALRYPTAAGVDRIKFLDGEKPKYRWAEKGGQAHWYGMTGAQALAPEGPERTLYVVNGEVSVWACQSRGIPAVAPVSGETARPTELMVAALALGGWAKVRVVYDLDAAGREGGIRVAAALRESGLDAEALELPAWLGEGADVDLLHRAVGERLAEELAALPAMAREERPRASKPGGVISIEELMAEPVEQVRYVVDGLLPNAGTSLLAGKPKVGKSTLARTIALAVARGEPVLGRATVKGPVLYLVMEEKRSEVAQWFRRAGATTEPIWVYVGSQIEDLPAFFAAHAARMGVCLVIVDPLHAVLRSGDINDYVRVNEAIQPLLTIARTGPHLMLVHHLGKGGDRQGGDRVLGSTALFGAVDALVTMTRAEGVFVVESIQRYGEDLEPTRVQRQDDTGLLLSAGPAYVARTEALADRILEFLGEQERTEDDIRTALGGNTAEVSKALRSLVTSEDALRRVARLGRGRKGDAYRYSRWSARTELDSTDEGEEDGEAA